MRRINLIKPWTALSDVSLKELAGRIDEHEDDRVASVDERLGDGATATAGEKTGNETTATAGEKTGDGAETENKTGF